MFMAASISLAAATVRAEDSAWVSLLNGKNLEGWTPYFQKLGLRNPDSNYRVSPEGYLHIDIKVDYNQSGFGHLFYTKRKFSYYMVRCEYRFPANTYGPNWGMGWNRENNGLMLHSQDPATMNGKDFPTSIEVQLLGKNNEQNGGEKAKGFKYATSANMCSPSTFVAFNGNNNYTTHCTAAQYPDAWKNTEIPWEDPAGWSDVTVRVLADSLVQHFIHGVKVFEYSRIRLDNGTPLKEGYISVQAEGTSTLFRNLEVLDLVGCMDQSKPAYRSYFVKHDAAACEVVSARPAAGHDGLGQGYRAVLRDGGIVLEGLGDFAASAHALDGRLLSRRRGPGLLTLPANRGGGVVLVRVDGPDGVRTARIAM
jgi:hypothetical protein